MPHTCLFTVTTGRSGTAYLTDLLRVNFPEAEVHHEILGYDAFGVDTPDLSDRVQFNAFGNTVKVQGFWQQKLARIADKPVPLYAETSHLLAKAGLIENLGSLAATAQVQIVLLRRDLLKTISSFQSRYDFLNKGNMWMWYLDPDYPRNIVSPTPLMSWGWSGICTWYVCEMLTRMEYYRLLFADAAGIRFIDANIDQLNEPAQVAGFLSQLGFSRSPDEIVIPSPQNTGTEESSRPPMPVEFRKFVEKMVFDPKGLADEYIRSGRRLG